MLRAFNLRTNFLRGQPLPRRVHGSFRPIYPPAVRCIHHGTRPPLVEQPTDSHAGPASRKHPLSILPLSTVVRSLFVTGVSATPYLLAPSLAVLSFLSKSKSPLLDPDQNSVIKYALSKTIYAQFCGGETPEEVRQSVRELKNLGYAGVILGYGKEVVMAEDEAAAISSSHDASEEASKEEQDEQLSFWKAGTLQTVDIAGSGDFVALKLTGAGRQSLRHLLKGIRPAPALQQALHDICERAKARNVRLLIDAEQQAVQSTIDAWTLDLQLKYNRKEEGHAVVYGTYQAYLRSTPETLAKHLAIAQAEGCILGVKLVRGAYLGSDPRHLIWERKEETDKMYDGIAESLMQQQYGDILKPSHPDIASSNQGFPEVNLVLATHNRASVKQARSIRDEQAYNGERMIDMAYGQLLGMADDISCELVNDGKVYDKGLMMDVDKESPRVCKYLVWGTVGECTRYLLRRAQENQDAASRTGDTRKALAVELKRRLLQGTVE